MKAQVIKKVNTRLKAKTAATKLTPLGVGSNVEVVGLERGELHRGSSQWLVTDNGNRHWAGAFNLNPGSSYFNQLGIDQLWNISHGDGIKVGMIDCGIQSDNKALKNFQVNLINNPTGSTCVHGSYMAAIIGGRNFTDNYIGVAPGCELLSASYVNESAIKVQEVIDGLNALNVADVINLSFASNASAFRPAFTALGKQLDDLINTYTNNGKIILAATGNNGFHNPTSGFFYPAYLSGTLSVAGGRQMGSDYIIEETSNCWTGVDLLGPIHPYFDLIPDSDTLFQGRSTGTSVTTAVLSGILALAYNKIKQSPGGLTKSNILALISDPVTAKSNKVNFSFQTNWLSVQKIKAIINT
jgi:hypothetical protein